MPTKKFTIMSTNNITRFLYLLVFSVYWINPASLPAQCSGSYPGSPPACPGDAEITLGGPTGPVEHLGTFAAGDPIDLHICVAGAGSQVAWSISSFSGSSSTGCHTDLNIEVHLPNDVEDVGVASSLPVVIFNNGATTPGTFQFTLNVSTPEGGSLTSQEYSITIRPPIDVMLVLDKSGSMGGDADPNTGGVQPKIDELKNVAELFIQTARGEASLGLGDPGDALLLDGDQIGAVYFSTSSDDSDAGLIPFLANGDDLLDPGSIGGLTAGGATAMGQGIRDGLEELEGSSGHSHNMIVITDGMQNVDPEVQSTGGGDPQVTLDRNEDSATQANEQLNDLDVKIFSIGLNTPTSHNELLDDMAFATGGQAYFNLPPANPGDLQASQTFSLQHAFIEGLIDLLEGASPQPVFYDYLSGPQDRTFQVNRNATQLRVLISANPQFVSTIRFQLLKDGQILNDIDGFVNILRGPSYQIAYVNLTDEVTMPNGDPFTREGEWTLHVETRPGIRYEASAVLDDHLLDYRLSIGDDDNLVDEPLALQAALNYRGQPLDSGMAVQVLILKPGEDLQTLLSETSTDPISQEDAPADASTKLQTLLNDPQFLAQLELEDQLITLTNNNDGTYSGSFANTDVTGSYRGVFIISGNPPGIGPFERTINRFAIVRVHSIDYGASQPALVLGQNNQIIGIRLRPRGVNNLLLGPGYARDIDVRIVSGAGTVGQIRDNLDGSYFIPISGLGPNDDPRIDVEVKGEDFYDGPLSGFEKGGTTKWLLEFLAGLGIMDNLNGIALGAELSRRFSGGSSSFDLLAGPYVNAIIGLEDPNYFSLMGGGLVAAEYSFPTSFRLRVFGKIGGINPNLSGEPGALLDEWGSAVSFGGTLAYQINNLQVGARGEWGSIRSGMNTGTDFKMYALTLGIGF